MKDLIDGFDCDGKPTGKKVRICRYQFDNCIFQDYFGDGAFFICKYKDINKCSLENTNE